MAGRLFYVMGASGAGKDSVMQGIRSKLCGSLVIAHRYITRPSDAGSENHVALTEDEFAHRKIQGMFAMHWQANGHGYGIGCEIESWLQSDTDVMMNGSRAYFKSAKDKYGSRVIPVWIEVNPVVLGERLRGRGRESEQEIQARLARAYEYSRSRPGDAWVIDNSGDLADSIEGFVQRYISSKKECYA
ncbi:ribose 1,5-bisphosphokinase [Parasalinivibrio latis]|uniref:ribose 1,5-bisphosphokinase n=1 Tax=Parasalinivibrio latis TaxID=2952610 RepID=UPI0030E4343A